MEMEGGEEETIKTLPEDLVERIIAMVPFPYVFKARVLSKSWLARFSSISSQDDKAKKGLAVSFQKQVSEWSRNWDTFCPVLISKENFMAFHHASHSWRRMPSLSSLPENLILNRSTLQIEGSLLYGFGRPEIRSRKKELYVANILTGSWKQLPPRSNAGGSVALCTKLVMQKSSEAYKVILFCREEHHDQFERFSAQIYDSSTDSWTTSKLLISSDFFTLITAAYFDGVLYMVAGTNPRNLLAFDVEKGTLKDLKMPFIDGFMRVVSVNLVVCNGNLLMIVTEGFHQQNQQVLIVDLESRRYREVARGPPPSLNLGEITTEPVSDGNCIFFRVDECGTRVLAYKVLEDEWSSFPCLGNSSSRHRRYKWPVSSFRPGFRPFVAV